MARLIAAGLSNRNIAATLHISLDTVKRHGSRVKAKLSLRSTAAIACLSLPVHLIPGRAESSLPATLTTTEHIILLQLCGGASSKHIARVTGASPRTVDKHRENLLRKCKVRSTRQLVALMALEYAKSGIVEARSNA